MPDSVYPDDVFVVSYPKSGNTWMRFLIGNYLTGNECTFENCHRITPDIHGNPEYCSEVERPRFIKSHSSYRTRYPNVVYIVRDGRDVAASYYHHSLKHEDISPETSFEAFLESFNQGEIGPFGIWEEHVLEWYEKASTGNFLLIRYEDMLEDSGHELKRVLSFAGMEVRSRDVRRAAEASSFENMRESEEKHHDEALGLADSENSKRFIRKGMYGDWKNLFTEALHKRFLRAHGDALEKLGYTTSNVLEGRD